MALLVSLHINDRPIGLLNIHNLGGDLDGECEYEVSHHHSTGVSYAGFTHSRPDGALECVRKAIVALEGEK